MPVPKRVDPEGLHASSAGRAGEESRTAARGASASLHSRLAAAQDPLALLEGLFVHAPVPYAIYDAGGHPVAVNGAYREVLGGEPTPGCTLFGERGADADADAASDLASAVRRAFRGEVVALPAAPYDLRTLGHEPSHRRERVVLAITVFPMSPAPSGVEYVAAAFGEARAVPDDAGGLAADLRESERQLRLITDVLPVLVTYIDDDMRYRVANRTYESWFGVPSESLVGKHVRELVGDQAYAQLRRFMERALSGEHVHFAQELTLPDGRTLYLERHYVPDTDASGATRGFIALVYDLTDRRRAEAAHVEARERAEALAAALHESEARYRSFVGQSTEGIWRFELDEPVSVASSIDSQIEAFYSGARLAECNDAMARMYGYECAGELIGQRLDALLVRDDPHNVAYLREFIENGYRIENGESHEIDRHGVRRIFRNSFVGVVEDGRLERAWGVQREITAEVDARQQAEAASRAKDEFLALLGHELRNPLSPIVTALGMMELRESETFAKERAIIERQIKHVIRLVDDLLDVSRITRGKVSLERSAVEVSEIVAAAVELASPMLEQRRQVLEIEVPRGLTANGDATRLAQVFANLLTNAAKYTPPAGRITVSGERSADRIRVCVRDTGLGIRPEMLPRLFDLFVQERQALDRSQGGLGLGLAIVRSLVELHGGTVRAESPGLGHGSTFCVELPAAADRSARDRAEPVPSSSARPEAWRVLVVDDNEDAAELLRDALTAWGHRVHVAYDGLTALAAAEAFQPELALLDIGLPAMDGYELARRLRALPGLGDVRLVAVTGYGQAKDKEATAQAGFDGHAVKPVALAALERLLSQVMTGAGRTAARTP